MEQSQQLTRANFATVIHQIFPEIQRVQKFSREGKILIDDALNCLFNAFDLDRSGRISYKKLCTGLDLLCDQAGNDPANNTIGGGTMFSRGSEFSESIIERSNQKQD
jgi:Ca2+-binding EF-hand superfamily protein